MKKIFFVDDTLEVGGNETTLANLLLGLNPTEFEPVLFCRRGLAYDYFESRGLHPKTPPEGKQAWAECTKAADCVVFSVGKGIDAAVSCRNWNIPFLQVRIGLASSSTKDLEETLITLSEGIICPSNFVAQKFENVVVIPNGVDTEFFSPIWLRHAGETHERLGFKSTDFIVGSSARLISWKRLDLLVDVVSILLKRGVPAKCLLLTRTDGEDSSSPWQEILEKIDRLELGSHIVFVAADPSDMPRFLGSMNVFVYPSVEDAGVPCSVLEAMSIGLPVVVADGGAASEPFVEGDPLKCDSVNAEAFADSAHWVFENRSAATVLGEKNRNIVFRHYTAGRMIKDYENFFRTVLK